MKHIDTFLENSHMELIKIFFKANGMNATVVEYTDIENYGFSNMIRIFLDDDSMVQATFMATRHAGFQNMLDDYLIKCGVAPHRLHVAKSTQPYNIKEATSLY